MIVKKYVDYCQYSETLTDFRTAIVKTGNGTMLNRITISLTHTKITGKPCRVGWICIYSLP